jgi:hypothetical protein
MEIKKKENTNCCCGTDSCCEPPKKKSIVSKVVFIAVILIVAAIITYKFVGEACNHKNESRDSSITNSISGSDTIGNKPCIKPCDPSKSASCCPK